MPTAEHFSTIARGNGFPFCLKKIDVSGFDYWMTLGGTQKGNAPTPSEIALSLTNAMHLFWNVYSITGSAMGREVPDQDFVTEFINQEVRVGLYYEEWGRWIWNEFTSGIIDDTDPAKEPRERVCGGQAGYYGQRYYMFESFREVSLAAAILDTYNMIVRMYDGDTSDEDNFVGYGVDSFHGWLDFWPEYEDWGDHEDGEYALAEEEYNLYGVLPYSSMVSPIGVYGYGFEFGFHYYAAVDAYVSYFPNEAFFSNSFSSAATYNISYSTLSGIPMIHAVFHSNPDYATAVFEGIEFYDYGTP